MVVLLKAAVAVAFVAWAAVSCSPPHLRPTEETTLTPREERRAARQRERAEMRRNGTIAGDYGGGGFNGNNARRQGGRDTALLRNPAPGSLTTMAARPPAGGQISTIDVGGIERRYSVYVPASVQVSGTRAPLVMAFHGGGGNSDRFADSIRLNQLAERYGFIAVAPQGVSRAGGRGGSWNAESITPQGYAENADIDDVGFVTAMLDRLERDLPVDTSRVYATGMSKGGMMVYHLACEIPDRLAAVAVVAGTLSSPDCRRPGGVSLLHIHGSDDENVPFEGGRGTLTGRGADYPAVSRAIDIFTTRNQCRDAGQTLRPAQDTRCVAQACNGSDSVQVCTVEGGGHAWPGADPARWQDRNNVYVSPHFDASDYIARFFMAN